MTILLADSGSTKTDWGLVENGKLIKKIRTSGMNPFQMSEEAITEEIKAHLVPELPKAEVDEVHFYGAGCTKEKQPVVERALRANLTIIGECEVASDMLGAARGICGHKPGIACILGTGSNSCSYDGSQLVKNVSPLGFILGDEGSGAVLGKILVGDVLKINFPRLSVTVSSRSLSLPRLRLSTVSIVSPSPTPSLPRLYLSLRRTSKSPRYTVWSRRVSAPSSAAMSCSTTDGRPCPSASTAASRSSTVNP